MIKLEIKDPKPVERKWIDKGTGEQRSMRIQTLLAYLPNANGTLDGTYDKVECILNNNQPSFPAGMYELTPACIYLDRNGRLQVGLSNIQPVANQQTKAA
ncbi:MAG TPA: hypothetical protein VK974_07205 [Methylophilaceae bacterium]|nr:hypothetical protein [Methylophilaceae bacterium]